MNEIKRIYKNLLSYKAATERIIDIQGDLIRKLDTPTTRDLQHYDELHNELQQLIGKIDLMDEIYKSINL